MSEIDFVVFCCTDPGLDETETEKTDIANAYLISTMFKSIQKHQPNSRLTVLTNKKSTFAGLTGISIKPIEINFNHLMYERTKAYLAFMQRAPKDTLVCFIDSDCLIINPLNELLETPFDLALTCTKKSLTADDAPLVDELGMSVSGNVSPINGGVIFSRPTRAALHTWNRIMNAYEELAAMGEAFYEGRAHLRIPVDNAAGETQSLKRWGGDQFSLMAVFGKLLMAGFPDAVDLDDAKVLFLDRNDYNYSPQVENQKISIGNYQAKIIHMKGALRKPAIPAIARHLGIA